MQKCGTVSGFSVQGCLEFVACSYVDLHVQEGNLLGGVFESEFDRGVEVIHENLHGLELFGGAQEDQEDVIYKYLPEVDCSDKGFLDDFFVTTHEEAGIWWSSLGSHGCANKLEKTPVHE